VELGRGDDALLDGRGERLAVLRHGDLRARLEQRVRVGHAQREGVHEVEAGPVRDAVEQARAAGRRDGVPAHVRQHLGGEPVDGAGKDAAALGAQAELDSLGEQDLHADADAEDRASPVEPRRDHLLAADAAQAGHAGGERAHAGHH
jgi:hypothetical protein